MRWFLLCVSLACWGCDAEDGDDEGGGTGDPVKACNDYVDASADLVVRACEGATAEDRSAIRKQIHDALPSGGCGGADDIRDPDSFYNECLPQMRSLEACPTEPGDLPRACRNQILYRR